ncbi:MAG TPA: hypothetical protein VF585_07555 [Chthoniobacterales bacterium]|jgi:hypothetical protein
MKSSTLTAVLLLSLSGLAIAEDVAPLDPAQILQELKDIEAKRNAVTTTRQRQNMDLIQKAAMSKEAAIALYEDAQMATQFQGANRENSQFREWKKKQEEQLKDSDFRESVRLHLFYLAMSMKRAGGAKPEEMVAQVLDYIKVLDNSKPAVDVKESLLKSSVSDGIFAKWLGIGPDLAKAENWEMNPGNSDAIAEKILLPEWRKQKSPALITYWDARIAREGTAAGSASLDFQEKNFASVKKPDLLWRRAQEFLVLDQPNRAAQEMFAIIKNFPTHPKTPEWIGVLQKQLAGGKETPAAS